MNPRELLILLLGLAIVAVVLRGLYVAIQARRGQIRLAIDKNIPSDVDLDELELAELPSGGARVKPRNNLHSDANAEVQRATARANAMDLGDQADDGIPVLMDAVQVRGADQEDEFIDDADDFADPDIGEEDFPEQLAVVPDHREEEVAADDWDDDDFGDEVLGPVRTSTRMVTEGEAPHAPVTATAESELDSQTDPDSDLDSEDPDAVLLDYEADGMSSLAPDYAVDEAEPAYVEEDYGEHDEETVDEAGFQQAVAESGETQDEPQEWDEDSAPDQETEVDPLADDGNRREPGMGSFEDELEEFSMSAGERIGYEGKPKARPVKQASLFDSDDDADDIPKAREARAARKPVGKRKSLFAAFARKKAPAQTDSGPEMEEPTPQVAPARTEPRPVAPSSSAEITSLDSAAASAEADPVPEPHYIEDDHQSVPTEPSEVLVVNVMAPQGREFAGDDLMHVLITSGLKFGDMNIFHQRLGNQPKGPVVFSVANMLNPGTFDLNNMESFRTVGVSLFLALPTAINNLDAFEKMLTVARQLCESLGGELKDDNRNGMTAQTIEHYRQRVRDFELRQLKAAGSRG